jgi:hypothetical protein
VHAHPHTLGGGGGGDRERETNKRRHLGVAAILYNKRLKNRTGLIQNAVSNVIWNIKLQI